ncbi:hypothetical protein B9479_007066 [Cryptococcus floricola]|uniref:Uncharacterized protein n=1 Tax=Cryptococcus floricola TaxID=2591691 RepID=A0A5D3ALD9_9TREE|nr:hypothetical protein B9479_007066 [Cryptococcus floricola]
MESFYKRFLQVNVNLTAAIGWKAETLEQKGCRFRFGDFDIGGLQVRDRERGLLSSSFFDSRLHQAVMRGHEGKPVRARVSSSRSRRATQKFKGLRFFGYGLHTSTSRQTSITPASPLSSAKVKAKDEGDEVLNFVLRVASSHRIRAKEDTGASIQACRKREGLGKRTTRNAATVTIGRARPTKKTIAKEEAETVEAVIDQYMERSKTEYVLVSLGGFGSVVGEVRGREREDG